MVGWARLGLLTAFCLALAGPLLADDPAFALSFDGTSDFVQIAPSTSVMAPDFQSIKSVSLWVNPTGTASCSANVPNQCDAIFGDDPRTWGISRGTIDGLDRIWIWNYDGTIAMVGVEYTPGEWMQVALVHDGSTLSAYKNGALVGSVASGPTADFALQGTLHFGGIIRNANRNWAFEGEIDEVRVWNTARTGVEIAADMNVLLTGAEPDLAAYYQMSDATGLTVTDNSGNGWNGTIVDGYRNVPSDVPAAWVASGAFDAGGGGSTNARPTADDQDVPTDEDVPVEIELTGSDADSDPLTFSVTDAPASGTLTGVAPSLTYTPNADFNGTDSFSFVTNDGSLSSLPGTITLNIAPVDDPPLAHATNVNAVEDNAVDVTLSGSDVDMDPLTFTVVSLPENGTLSGTAPNLNYTPDANFNGLDSFSFLVNDGQTDSDPATVTLSIAPVNDPPVADPATFTTDEDLEVFIVLTASDVEGDPITFSVTSLPASGELTGTAPNLTYTPDPDFNGDDFFSFVASDLQADSVAATVVVTVNSVNDPPVATDDSVTTTIGDAIEISVLTNDTDVDGHSLLIDNAAPATSGTVTNNGTTVTYSPNVGFTGNDSFTYTASDGFGGLDSATVFVTVDPANPEELTSIPTPGNANGIALAGGNAYVADLSGGLRIISVANPLSPFETGSLSTPGDATDVTVVGDRVYVSDSDSGLRIIDAFDPANPSELGFHDTPGSATSVGASGFTVYVADGPGGLSVIDASDPANPSELAFYPTQGEAVDIAVNGTYLLVAESSAGFRIFDISVPAAPQYVGVFQSAHPALGVSVSGTLAYVAAGNGGLQIVDISNPALPMVGSYDTPGAARRVFVSGSKAYVADGEAGLRVIDVADPTNPFEIGSYDSPGTAQDVAVAGSSIFLADYDAGIRVLSSDSGASSGNGYGLSFDGTSDFVEIAETASVFGPGWESSKTVSLWVQPTGTPYCFRPSPALCDAIFGDRPRWWGISRGEVNGDDRIWIWNYDGQLQYIGIDYVPDEWVHIAMVHENGTMSAYKNGVLVASVPSGPTLQPNTGAFPVLHFGGIINNANRNWTFEGEIDELQIWSVGRSVEEIIENMITPLSGNENGLAAYYRMSDGSGDTLTDDSGNGWTGTLNDGHNNVPPDGPIEWVFTPF